MGFMKKDMNSKLLLLTLLPLLFFTIFSVNYNLKLSKLVDEYQQSQEELNRVSGMLSKQESQASQVERQKLLLEQDKQALEQEYSSISRQNEVLLAERNNLEERVKRLFNALERKSEEALDLRESLNQTATMLAETEGELAELYEEFSGVETERDAFCQRLKDNGVEVDC